MSLETKNWSCLPCEICSLAEPCSETNFNEQFWYTNPLNRKLKFYYFVQNFRMILTDIFDSQNKFLNGISSRIRTHNLLSGKHVPNPIQFFLMI